MNQLVQKFIAGEIKKNQKVLEDYNRSENLKPLGIVGQEVEIPKEVVFARAQLDAFVRVANFLGDSSPDVQAGMSNEEAIRTATTLFLNDANREPFDWFNGPSTELETLDILNKAWDQGDASKCFNRLLQYWYKFQRNK